MNMKNLVPTKVPLLICSVATKVNFYLKVGAMNVIQFAVLSFDPGLIYLY